MFCFGGIEGKAVYANFSDPRPMTKPYGGVPGSRACSGFTLVELMIAIAIVGFLVLVSGVSLHEAASRNDVLNCAKRITADIKEARRWAQGGGNRVIFLTSAIAGQDGGARDLDRFRDTDRERHDEYYIIFPDTFFGAKWQNSYRPSVRRRGVKGDELCDEDVVFLGESTLSSSVPRRSSQAQLVFSSLGTLLNFGSVNKNLYLEKNGHVVRIEVVALTGFTRIYLAKESYQNCGGADCDVGTWSNDVNDQWQPLQATL